MRKVFRNGQRSYSRFGNSGFRHSSFSESPMGLLPESFGSLVGFDELRLLPGNSVDCVFDNEAEVVIYVHRGTLTQEDGAANLTQTRAGEFQRVSTCCNIRYREMIASGPGWTHLFRMILRVSKLEPDVGNEKRRITAGNRRNSLCIVASPDGRNGSLRIHQNVYVYSAILEIGKHLVHEILPGRISWVHLIYGGAVFRDSKLTTGDSISVYGEPSVSFTVTDDTELLLVDLEAREPLA